MYLALVVVHVLAAAILIGGTGILSQFLIPRVHKSVGVKRATQELFTWMNYTLIVSLVTGISIALVKFEPSFVFSSAFMKLPYAHSWMTKIVLLIGLGALMGITGAKVKRGDKVDLLIRIAFVITLVALVLGVSMTRI